MAGWINNKYNAGDKIRYKSQYGEENSEMGTVVDSSLVPVLQAYAYPNAVWAMWHKGQIHPTYVLAEYISEHIKVSKRKYNLPSWW